MYYNNHNIFLLKFHPIRKSNRTYADFLYLGNLTYSIILSMDLFRESQVGMEIQRFSGSFHDIIVMVMTSITLKTA